MKILILGGTGVLSRDIVKKSLQEGHELYIVNRGHFNTENYSSKNCHIIIGDVRKLDAILPEIKEVRYDVIADFLSFEPAQLESSYSKLANLCKQYIFISSCCVFRRAKEDGIISESSPKPNPLMSYSINKLACEKKLSEISKDYDCSYTIVRPYITYGDTRIPYGIAPYGYTHYGLVERILNGKPLILWDQGEATCSLLHTEDFAKIFCKLYLNKKAINEDVNITNEKVYTWKSMVETFYKCCHRPFNYVCIPSNQLVQLMPELKESVLGDRALNGVFDHTKLYTIVSEARGILSHAISIEEGITRTIEYYKGHNYMSGINYLFDARMDKALEKFNHQYSFKYIDYLGKNKVSDKLTYFMYRNFSCRNASFVMKWLYKIKNFI